jgi:catechol 2,3-dioxygenase-like lactoylglutathione lyase family enzyme
VEWKLEVVVVPVADVDRAKEFYGQRVGFAVDHDTRINDAVRIVQLTPLGSGCSIVISSSLTEMRPGSLQGLQLVVSDVDAARAHLAAGGVDVSPVRHIDNGVWIDGRGGPWNSFVFFSDPDGNSWTVQERPRGENL